MRKTMLNSAALVLLAGMFGGQITELFDYWDHTAQTGRDVDYTVVVIAASLGVVFGVGRNLIPACIRLLSPAKLLDITLSTFGEFRVSPEPLDTGPPLLSPSPLRI